MAKATDRTNQDHPILGLLTRLEVDLEDLAQSATWSLSQDETRQATLVACRVEAQIAELGRRVLAEADHRDLAADTGGTSTANWLAHETKLTRAEAHRRVRHAKALFTREQTRTALATGGLHLEQATAITHAVDALPADKCAPETIALVEKTLIEYAEEFDAKTLKILGRRVWELIDPEAAEAHEAEQLSKEEDAAAEKTKLTMHDDGTGTVRGRFTIPLAQAAMFKKLLLGFAAPKHQNSTDNPTPANTPSPKRMGEAFCELIEAYSDQDAPRSGGISATAVVHIPWETLTGGVRAAHLDTGEPLSPSQARRIACEAGIIPVVLNGQSEVLDLGRTRRFHTKAQRIAAGIEHPQCQTANCDWPSGMCHLHHLDPWSRGGRTDLKRTAVLCPRHHTLIHHQDYEHQIRADGSITFHRRV